MQMFSTDIGVMTLGLDMDNTITALPSFFRLLSESCRGQGGKVYVISSRCNTQEVMEATRHELTDLKIPYDGIYLLSDVPTERIPCPHEDELSSYQAYLWQKVKIAEDLGVTVFFDDDQHVVELFNKYAKGIHVFQGR